MAVGSAYNPRFRTERGSPSTNHVEEIHMRHRWAPATMVALILLTACQGSDGGSPDAGSSEGTGAEPIEIDEAAVSGEVRLSGGRSSDAEEALLEETLAAFSDAYPDIEVIYEPIPEDYATVMIGQFSTGDPPDLFYVGATGEAAPWIGDDLLEPLDGYIAGNPEIGRRFGRSGPGVAPL